MKHRYDPQRPAAASGDFHGQGNDVESPGGKAVEIGEIFEQYGRRGHFTGFGEQERDIVMSRERRLLGPLEAANGMLMLGMSAAALMAIVQHMIAPLREAAGG